MNCILLPAENFSSDTAKIDSLSQVSHVTKVLGAKVGDTLKIGQIGGNLGTAVIEDITADSIQLSNVQLNTVPPAKLDLTVILALPRPKVLRRLIMDMTALGVRDIILINSYRTQKSYWQSPMLERIDEFVLEGLQQSIDTIVPSITLQKRFKPFSEFLQLQPSRELPSIVCIGAEGGWIDYEIEMLSAQGCTPVHIGSRILRTEAAVNAILGQWLL